MVVEKLFFFALFYMKDLEYCSTCFSGISEKSTRKTVLGIIYLADKSWTVFQDIVALAITKLVISDQK